MEQTLKVDGNKIRALREARAWSQDQLATAAGVSLRTVQRAENESTASNETKVCLAAAFNVDHGALAASSVHQHTPDDSGYLMARTIAQAFGATALLMLLFHFSLGERSLGGTVFWIAWTVGVIAIAFTGVAIAMRKRLRKA